MSDPVVQWSFHSDPGSFLVKFTYLSVSLSRFLQEFRPQVCLLNSLAELSVV